MKKALILGAGVMGSAMSWPLADNGHQVSLVGTHLDNEIIQSCKENRWHPLLKRQIPESVTPYFIDEIDEARKDAQFFVSGVSSAGVHWAGRAFAEFLQPGDRLIAITKGLEVDGRGEIHILPEVLRAELPLAVKEKVQITAVGGPCIAGELAGRRQSCVYFGCRQIETAKFFQQLFRTDYYHVFATNQVVALEVAVALKNAYALGVGLAAGLLKSQGGTDAAGAFMHNTAAALFAQAGMEIATVLSTLNEDVSFAYGLPGIGDLYVTSQGGRSVRLGNLLGEGKSYQEALLDLAGETLESAMIIQEMSKALPAMVKKGKITKSDLPFMRLLIDLVVNEQPLHFPFDDFFTDLIKKKRLTALII